MDTTVCIRAVLLDFMSIFIVYLPWIILQTIQPFKRGFYCDDESLRHPYKDSTIPGPVATTLSILINVVIVLIIEGFYVWYGKKHGIKPKMYKIGKFDFHPFFLICYKVLGVYLFGAAAQQTITNIGKYSVGRLRPHFFDVCKPDYSMFNCTDARGYYMYITEDVCQNNDEHRLKEMRLSFPSGHSSLTSFSMVYVAVSGGHSLLCLILYFFTSFKMLYLEYRLRWKGSHLLRPFCQMIFLWLSLATCLTRISDYKHHWSDVLVGALLGVTVAFICGIYIAKFFKTTDLKVMQDQINRAIEKSKENGEKQSSVENV